MTSWATPALETFWRNGVSAVPLVLSVAAVTRWIPVRRAGTSSGLLLMAIPLLPSVRGWTTTTGEAVRVESAGTTCDELRSCGRMVAVGGEDRRAIRHEAINDADTARQ